MSRDGGGKHMAIVGVWQYQRVDEPFVPLDHAIFNCIVHQFRSSRYQFFEFRAIA